MQERRGAGLVLLGANLCGLAWMACVAQPEPATTPSHAGPSADSLTSSVRASTAAAASPPLDDPKTCIDAPLAAREELRKAMSSPGTRIGLLDSQGRDTEHTEQRDVETGRLPPVVIRRVVREHYGVFGKCYEPGLQRHAELRGKVTVRFVIELGGEVSNVTVVDTDLPDCSIVRCVRDAFSAIQFPKPEGGIVTVSYPVQLTPARASAPEGASEYARP